LAREGDRDINIEKGPFKEERFVYLLFAAAFLCGGHPEFLCGVLAYGPPGVLSGYCVIASKRPTGASCDHLLVSRLLLLACNSNRLGDVIRHFEKKKINGRHIFTSK
jgi:hypothetical protein